MVLKKIDILMFKGTGFVSKIIQWGTNSPYQHTAVVVSGESNIAIEAMVGTGVRAIDTRKSPNVDVYRLKHVIKCDSDKVLSYLADSLGKPYDYLGVAYLAILKLFRMKHTANKWQKERDLFCSELCNTAFKEGGVNLVPDKPSSVVSPADISNSKLLEKVNG